ncbi:MAG: lamin tail domain-containing protein, partial [Verrucomicrobiales bacterium]
MYKVSPHRLAALCGALIQISFVAPASAGTISINFEGGQQNQCCGGGGSAEVTGTAGFAAAANWNNFPGNSGSGLALFDDSGSESGATVSYSVNNNWAATNVAPGDGANADMMSGYLDNFGGQTISVVNLDASYTAGGYDVIIYFNADNSGTQGFTINGVTHYGRQAGGAGSNYPLGGTNGFIVSEETVKASAPAANAVRFTGLSSTSFTVTGAAGGGGDRARPNGIQIIGTEIAGLAAVSNTAASSVTASSAQLNGTITDIGESAPTVKIFYGTSDAGFDEASWDASVTLAGTQSGAFSAGVGGLSAATAYFFRAQATNSAGTSWATSAQSFETDSETAAVTNIAATDIGASLATVGANVTSTGGDTPTVTIHYGTVDGGTGFWQQSVSLGQQPGSATTTLNGLLPSTLYFFRASASNTGGLAWAPSSSSFTTGGVSLPAVVNDDPSGITGTTANLRGEVTDPGFDPPAVTVYYGGSDGGTSTGAWENSIVLGVRDGDFSAFITALDPESNYFFRAAATNSAGTAWAPSTAKFATTPLVPDTVIINEIHYDPDGIEPEEFVELHNPSDSPIDLSGWAIEGGIDFSFPGGTTIGVGGYLVVAADPATIEANFNAMALGPFEGKLGNDGERIELR